MYSKMEGSRRRTWGMFKFLYTYRFIFSIWVAIFAAQAAYLIRQGRPITGSVLGGMALLGLALLFTVIYKNDGTIFNKTTLNSMIVTILMVCIYGTLLALFPDL